MRTLLAAVLSILAAQAYGQSIEADLDGNASALQSSEMRSKQSKQAERQRVAAR